MRRIALIGWAFAVFAARASCADEPGAMIEPPPAITTTNVPPIPRSAAEMLAKYQNIRSASFQGWAPNGEGILIGTRFANSVQLHRVRSPGAAREQWTFFEEPAGGRFVPESDAGNLLVTMSQGGNENEQVYFYERESYQFSLLSDGKSRNLLGPITLDGQRMIVSSNRRNEGDTDLYVVPCAPRGEWRMLMETEGEYWVPQDWSPDGHRVLISQYVSINEGRPAELNVETGARTILPLPVQKEGQKAAVGGMAYSPDGHTAYLATDARGEFVSLWALDLPTKEFRPLIADLQWDVEEFDVSRQDGSIAVALNADGASQLFVIQGEERRELRLPLGIVGGVKFSPDGKSLGFTLARPNAPADAFSVNIATGELTQWTFSETGCLNPKNFVSPTRIRFPSFDGREIPAYYFAPRQRAGEKSPVVIQIHGGPESQYRPIFSSWIQYAVNESGVAVICPNVRGSAGYGKTYLDLDNAILREDSVKDIGALLDWTARQPELDAGRVAVVGGSYGGYMVLASLEHFGDRIRAGVDHVGIANFITFLENTSEYRRDLRRVEYGDERDPEIRAFFERINPTARVDQIRSALMVAHGKNDPRVPFSEAEEIVRRVTVNGGKVWTVFADNEGHGFAKRDNRDFLTAVEMAFLRQFLLGP